MIINTNAGPVAIAKQVWAKVIDDKDKLPGGVVRLRAEGGAWYDIGNGPVYLPDGETEELFLTGETEISIIPTATGGDISAQGVEL